MAVYKRRYNSYTGSLTPERWRLFVLTRFAFADLFKSRVFVLLLVLALVPTLGFAGYIFLVNNKTVQLFLQMRTNETLTIETQFFVILIVAQTNLAFLLNCWVGPVLIAGDLTNGALPLFLSRPFNRSDYVLGKLAVLGVLLSAVTWVPTLMLFGLQSGLANGGWLWSHLWMVIPIVLCSAIWILMLSLISLAVSALVKLRIVATGVIFVSLFIPLAIGEIFNAIMGTYWGHLLNFPYLFQLILNKGFREPEQFTNPRIGPEIPVTAAWAVLILVCVLCLLIINARLRAREVVRG
jgi:ABC-type transport system involved in multi-copper enzyme maturation permease subunit